MQRPWGGPILGLLLDCNLVKMLECGTKWGWQGSQESDRAGLKGHERFLPQSSRKPLEDVSGQRDGLPYPKIPLSVFGEGTVERWAGTQESRQVAMPVAPERARDHLDIGME